MITFRRPIPADRPMIMEWIASDEEHREKGMSPDFFFNEESMSLVLGDDHGPGLFVRVDPESEECVRLHIQFSPDEVKSAKTMLRGWPTFCERIWMSGMNRMVFESKSKRLIAFCCRVFDFHRVEGTDDYELVKAA